MKKKKFPNTPSLATRKRPLNINDEEITPAQALFAVEYLKDFNATKAYIRAGNPAKSARQLAWRMLNNPSVNKAISNEFKKVTTKVEVNVEYVLKELMQIADCDIKEAFNEDGTLKSIHDIPTSVRKSIASFDVEELYISQGRGMDKLKAGELKKVKFWDKKGSLELLGKYLAMFIERQQHESPGGLPLAAPEIHIHKHVVSVSTPIADTLAVRPEVEQHV